MAATEPSLESQPTCLNLPPLRVAHVLLYLAVASAYLMVAMSHRLNPPAVLRSAADERYRRIIEAPPALGSAATTTVFVLLIVWTVQRRRAWTEPGHWIALWLVWICVAPYCTNQLFQLIRIIAGVGLRDDWTNFYPWASSFTHCDTCRLRSSSRAPRLVGTASRTPGRGGCILRVLESGCSSVHQWHLCHTNGARTFTQCCPGSFRT